MTSDSMTFPVGQREALMDEIFREVEAVKQRVRQNPAYQQQEESHQEASIQRDRDLGLITVRHPETGESYMVMKARIWPLSPDESYCETSRTLTSRRSREEMA